MANTSLSLISAIKNEQKTSQVNQVILYLKELAKQLSPKQAEENKMNKKSEKVTGRTTERKK